jgi:hypothetical protein
MSTKTPRELFIQALFVLNVFFLLGGSVGMMFTPEAMFPNLAEASRPVVRAFGALNFSMGYLVMHLGPAHHAAYCLVMTFHLLTACLIGFEAVYLQPEQSKPRFFAVSGGHSVGFAVMLLVLVTGGLAPQPAKASPSKKATKKQ